MIDALKKVAAREGGIAHVVVNANLINDEVHLFTPLPHISSP